MKKAIILLMCFVLSNQIFAQNESRIENVSIGYLGNVGYRPGIKVGTQFSLKKWETPINDYTKLKSFYVNPQVGFYTYPKVHTGYVVNADFGYKRIKDNTQQYSAFSIGLGGLLQSQITKRAISLTDGSSENIRENWSWFLSTVNYEFGKAINEQMGWYSKASYGFKVSTTRENASVLFLEAGVQFKLF